MANRYIDMDRVDEEVSALFFYCLYIFADKYFLYQFLHMSILKFGGLAGFVNFSSAKTTCLYRTNKL